MLPVRQTITCDIMLPGSYWELIVDVNGYKNEVTEELSTQAKSGRKFEIIANLQNWKKEFQRIKVRLLEDGYICFFSIKELNKNALSIKTWNPHLLNRNEIKPKLPKILKWIEQASKRKNYYLWGGTIGPNFDCSGLIQSSFASEGIWLPRDAYQQESFCKSIEFNSETFDEVLPGDLIFFGTQKKCTHVGLYKGNQLYWHSSGSINGRNGIGIDQLQPTKKNKVSIFYRSILRSIGRVNFSHNGKTLP
tara:strand:+ start:505 stop:1251 length:747 start_codon:yes stop_codon:yes gene_type:complete